MIHRTSNLCWGHESVLRRSSSWKRHLERKSSRISMVKWENEDRDRGSSLRALNVYWYWPMINRGVPPAVRM